MQHRLKWLLTGPIKVLSVGICLTVMGMLVSAGLVELLLAPAWLFILIMVCSIVAAILLTYTEEKGEW